jgi:hypothetical protein
VKDAKKLVLQRCDVFWMQVYVTIKNNVGGGMRYLSPTHGAIAVAGTSSAVTGSWYCGQVRGESKSDEKVKSNETL